MIIMDLIASPPFPKFLLKPGSPNVTVFGNRPFKEEIKNELTLKVGLKHSYNWGYYTVRKRMCIHTEKVS